MAFDHGSYEPNKFRHPRNNARFTRQLFYEYGFKTDKQYVLYTLKRTDHEGYPSLYRLYIEMEDVTEWEFANKYFEDFDHWQVLCECEWFKPLIRQWRDELQRKLTARGLAVVKNEAMGGGRNALAAAKYLMERGWESKEEKLKMTKDAKEAIKKEAQRIAEEEQSLNDAMERVGLRVVK